MSCDKTVYYFTPKTPRFPPKAPEIVDRLFGEFELIRRSRPATTASGSRARLPSYDKPNAAEGLPGNIVV
jgi:hypothetical protein